MNDLEYLRKYGNSLTYLTDKKKLEAGYPVQYLVGNVDFYGCLIEVNPSVLIPRFETEQLVEKLLKRLSFTSLRILDLGTGSGCIAIAIAKNRCDQVDAVEIDLDALAVARRNAFQNNVSIQFYQGDFFSPIEGMYDVIVSNPPYIDQAEEIEEKVKKYEPASALYADHHGLACYEKILKDAPHYLKENGLLAFEIGYQQKEALCKLGKTYFPHAEISIEKDYAGKDRFFFLKNNRD